MTVDAQLPPATVPTIVGYGSPRSVISGSVSSAFRRASSASRARTRSARLSSADTPSRRVLACAARPGTVSRNVIAPACATTMSRPDGSGDHAGVTGRAGADRRERPLAAVLLGRDEDDEQLARERPRRPRRAPAPARAARIAAIPPFMSHAPRPYRRPVADRRRPTGRPSRSWPRRAAPRRRGPRGSAARPPPCPAPREHHRQRGPWHLLAGPGGVLPDRRGVGVEDLDARGRAPPGGRPAGPGGSPRRR